MAEASLLPIAQSLLGKLASYAFGKIILYWGAKDDLKKLVSSITIIKAGLLDAERRQESRNHEGELVREWIRRLRNVLYDADDLFDRVFTIEESKQRLIRNERFVEELEQFFSKDNQIALQAEIVGKIRQIRVELDGIKSDMANFAFDSSLFENSGLCYDRETGSVKAVDDIIGREEDQVILMGLLMDATSKEEGLPDVIAIVGFGGLGKTTLAQLLYNNNVVKESFELHAWACISDTRGTTAKARIILDALQTTGSSERRNVEKDVSVDKMEQEIQKEVQNKKYLLVFDDFWDEDHNTWLYLKGLLRGGKMGSKILVTTRSSNVACAMGVECPYDIKGLSDDKAWELFKTLALRSSADSMDQDLISMGKEIVRKCRNVPLAIKAIASLLYTCRDNKRVWKSVMESDMLTLEKQHNLNVLPVLKLSYNHLPSHLKHCFAFCSVFPKDFKMEGEKLIFYWIAHGYVLEPDRRGQNDLMRIGKTYLKELVSRSFLQEDAFEDGIYKMHDLMHDLAQDVAGKELVRIESARKWLDVAERIGEIKSSSKHVSEDARIRHLSICGTHLSFILPLKKTKYLRSLVADVGVSRSAFKVLSNLRLLDLSNSDFDSLCSSIGKLKLLRCLIISNNNWLSCLPEEICKLYNLKILNVSRCGALKTLPRNLNRLSNLTCLRVDDCRMLMGFPRTFGALSSLESLDCFMVWESSGEFCGLEALDGLVNLRDEKLIVQFQKWRGGTVSKEDDKKRVDLSSSLVHLEWLELRWEYDNFSLGIEELEFQCSHLPPNLKRLEILYFPGQTLPEWATFNKLLVVCLRRCMKCRYLPSFGQQSRVKSLTLGELDELQYIQMEEDQGRLAIETHFPFLETLVLAELPKLKAWSPAMEKLAHRHTSSPTPAAAAFPIFPSLTRLDVIKCPELMSIPLPPKAKAKIINQSQKEPLRSLLHHADDLI